LFFVFCIEERRVTSTNLSGFRAIAVLAVVICLAGTAGCARTETASAPKASDEVLIPDALVQAAKKEGHLNVIALPHDWCGYGDLIAGFKAKYGITVSEFNPDAGSVDELEAVRSTRGDPNKAPDVLDLGVVTAQEAKADGLLQPYKVVTWRSIADKFKDTEGYWYGDYYGLIVFQVNTEIVKSTPLDWASLKSPSYKNMVALGGDPHNSYMASLAVFAAGLAAAPADVSEATRAGLIYFADLHQRGNLLNRTGNAGNFYSGGSPIVLRWDYLAFGERAMKQAPKMEIVLPRSGAAGAIYAQAISAFAPHPNAAKLWMEYLYSDEGQLGFMKGYCNAVRSADLYQRGRVPANIAAGLLPPSVQRGVVFPNPHERQTIRDITGREWDKTVGLIFNN
jgi:putative spermidine/putrescine transport system substrate-binding protein